ncbi:MAG: hypothetical protein IJX86_06585 [Lachnospiraceae bacterium]|nr:hypothetical protein [Lachnospiraceae bacterium]
MRVETFNYLWEQGIAKAAQSVIDEISADALETYNVKLDVSKEMCGKVYSKYEELRLQVRKKYFNTGNNDENKIDGHKICACITGALLNVRLVSFEIGDGKMPKSVIYSNYAIAFMAAIYVMFLFLLSDYEKDGNVECYNSLIKKATFAFPETNPGHDPYVQGRIKTLALNDICGIDFDILTYADMLFWIEKYNKDLLCNVG